MAPVKTICGSNPLLLPLTVTVGVAPPVAVVSGMGNKLLC